MCSVDYLARVAEHLCVGGMLLLGWREICFFLGGGEEWGLSWGGGGGGVVRVEG